MSTVGQVAWLRVGRGGTDRGRRRVMAISLAAWLSILSMTVQAQTPNRYMQAQNSGQIPAYVPPTQPVAQPQYAPVGAPPTTMQSAAQSGYPQNAYTQNPYPDNGSRLNQPQGYPQANQQPPGYQQPYQQPPGYQPAPGYGQPSTNYQQPGFGGASQANAPFVTTQSSGVQLQGSSALPAPVGVQSPALGYGAPGTYVPEQVSAYQLAPGVTGSIDPNGGTAAAIAPGVVPISPESMNGFTTPTPYQPRIREAPIDIYVQEARTGRIVLGGSVNSDLGVAGQVIIDERNFDYRRLPTSWGDLFAGRAFRGAGQNFRAELMPGTNVQRYTVNFTQPHLFGYSRISFSLGGFLFSRQFRDWTEQRLGGRMALGYDITRDLSLTTELRMEDVKIYDPRLAGVSELDRVLGSNDLYTARVRLAHDTRDSPFMATEGHLIELIYDQVFGEYDYPRGQVNLSRYFLIRERADGGGRHTLATSWKAGITGADTPLFENFFAGGYSTLRGFSFRGASPKTGDLQVGGRTMLLGSIEYLFPLTADDMLRGIFFVDYGALSKDLNVAWSDYRIAPGLGLRVNVPALGPAPLAFDFAFPVKYNDTDDRQVFSFFMGFTR